MIQATVTDGRHPSSPFDLPPMCIGGSVFLRDRTVDEALHYLRTKVTTGEFIEGSYRIYENGTFKGSWRIER